MEKELAKIIIVMESRKDNQPLLSDKAGSQFKSLLASAGIAESHCYITSVTEETTAQLQSELIDCHPNVIIAVGAVALKALTGHTKINSYRGSILKSTLLINQKIIPTLNTARVLRGEIELLFDIQADLAKAKYESDFPGFDSIPVRNFILKPSFKQVIDKLEEYKTAIELSLDIEGIRKSSIITEIGIGPNCNEVMTIPIFKGKPVWSVDQEIEIWERLQGLLTDPRIGKLIQHCPFELGQLFKWVGEIHPMRIDTMIPSHLCYCERPLTLSYMTSIYTNEPHYKLMREEDDYNAKDVGVLFDLADTYDNDELPAAGLYDFCYGFVMPLLTIFWQASHIGLNVDRAKMEEYKKQAENERDNLQEALDIIVGYPLNVKSPKQMQKYLYSELGLKTKRFKGKITTNEKALLNLQVESSHPSLNLMIQISNKRTAISNYLNTDRIDPDGRIHTHWKITGTKTGRLSSTKNIRGTGCNLQNIPKNVRDIFIPSTPDRSFVVGDLSQADARFVAYLAEDPAYMKMFESGKDIHKQVAGWIFKISPEAVNKTQRKSAKASAHGAPYGMTKKAVAIQYGIPENEAQWLMSQYHQMFPNVRAVFQHEVKEQLKNEQMLTSPFGRRRIFMGWYNQDQIRSAYAQIPQGCTADTIDMAAVRIHFRLPASAHIMWQVHDELGIECDDKDIDLVAQIFKEEAEKPIMVKSRPVIIPVDLMYGKTWHEKDLTSWKG